MHISLSPILLAFLLLLFLRLFFVALSSRRRRLAPLPRDTCSVAIFLGSGEFGLICFFFRYPRTHWPCRSLGGHTNEALKLASSLDFNRYTPRTYIISEGDAFSAQKALALEHIKSSDAVTSNVRDPSGACLFPKSDTRFIQPQYKLLTIPRARRVHQPLLTTPPDAVKSLLACISLISVYPLFMKGAFRRPFADLLILNGPGTCVILYAAVLLNRVGSRFRGIVCIILMSYATPF